VLPRPNRKAELHRILRKYFEDLSEVMAEAGQGEAYGPLLARVGLGPEALAGPEGGLTFDSYIAALEALDQEGRIPGLGLKLGAKKRLRNFGFAGFAAIAQGSLARSHAFVVSSFEFYWGHFLRLEERVGQDWLVGRYHATPPLLAFHATVMEQAVMTAVRLITESMPGLDWSACQVRFVYPAPRHAALYAEFLPMPYAFDQPHSEMWFPASWAERPLALGDETVKEFCEAGFQSMMEEDAGSQSLGRRVHDHLADAEPGRWPGLEELALRLGMPVRRMRAGLAQEGTSYRTILNAVVIEQAQEFLANPRLSSKEIAFRLGFAQPPSFFRAFTKATGLTPEQFRAQASQTSRS